MKEAEKSLASKTEVSNALDLRNENSRNKIEQLQPFDSLVNVISKMMEHKIIYYFSQFINIKMLTSSSSVTVWKSKDLSNESTEPPSTSNNILNRAIYYNSTKIHIKCHES